MGRLSLVGLENPFCGPTRCSPNATRASSPGTHRPTLLLVRSLGPCLPISGYNSQNHCFPLRKLRIPGGPLCGRSIPVPKTPLCGLSWCSPNYTRASISCTLRPTLLLVRSLGPCLPIGGLNKQSHGFPCWTQLEAAGQSSCPSVHFSLRTGRKPSNRLKMHMQREARQERTSLRETVIVCPAPSSGTEGTTGISATFMNLDSLKSFWTT